jgi:hypothetical protein
MIVRFVTDSGTLSMYGEPAVQLLRMMGHSGTVPGAILAADLPAAVEKLRAALASADAAPAPASHADDDDDGEDSEDEAPIALQARALPLMDMLETAVKGQSGLMWDRA